MEAAILDNLRQGHSIRAACAAAGVALRTYQRFVAASPAHRHDREVAEQESERRLVGIVLQAAATDAKHAEWLLARRWPDRYGDRQQIDLQASIEQRDPAVLALAERYAAMTADEIEQEMGRLAWVVPHPPANTAGEERSADGGATAIPLLPVASTDKTPDTAPDTAEVALHPEPVAIQADSPPQPAEPLPPLEVHRGPPPHRCPHCRGTHEAGCPQAMPEMRIQPWNDPRA